MSTGRTVLILAILAIARAEIPSGYIMQITATCGDDANAIGSLDIITDLDPSIKAVCSGGTEVDFASTDNVNFVLPFSYQGGTGEQTCEFLKRDGAEVYTAKVVISIGQPRSRVHLYTDEYTITCTFNAKNDDHSAQQTVIET